MNVVRSKWYIFLVLVVLIITYIFFIYNNNNNSDNITLDEVRLKEENIINSKNFAIMVEKSDGSGYEEVDTFPSGIPLNTNLSGCIDVNGKIINGALSYQDGKVRVYVNSTAYCYLYFSQDDVAPVVSLSVINNETENAQLVITSNETGTYCVNTSSTLEDMSNCIFEGTIYGNVSFTTNVVPENGTYYVHVKDGGNNIGVSNEVKVTASSKIPLGNYLLANQPAGLNTTLEGGLYRFQGTSGNVNNFICFGTSDKNTCLGNTDAYIYRIIGITEDGRIKLIKNEALNSTITWYSSSSSNIAWPSSAVYSNINGSSFLTNSSYMPNGWSDKIETTTWKYGDNTTINTTAESLFSTENSWSNTTNAKIGLIYAHDYAYAYQSGGLNCSGSGPYSTCKTSWMYISNCDSAAPNTTEWTMSRYVYDSSSKAYRAWLVSSNGDVNIDFLSRGYSVRPVFYLTYDVSLVSGTGTSIDPFIIS